MPDNIYDNFLGLPPEYSEFERSAVVILPVSFDLTSTWQKGADKSPAAIISASQNVELYDIETDSEMYKQGVFTDEEITAITPELMIEKTYERVLNCLNAKKFVVTLGGEHSISIGAMKAHVDFYKDISILHLDAHSDSRDCYEESIYNHACVIARAREMADVISAGIRSMDSSELPNIKKENIFFAHNIHGSSTWIDEIADKLSDKVYITLDLDVFDPAYMPSTGTPEPGGLDWYQVNNLIKKVNQKKKIVGIDVVELCPSEHNKAPDFLAAKLIYRTLSEIFALRS